MTYTYNLSGALIEQKYPSGRVVKNVLYNDGDLSIVQSKKTQTSGYWNYADNFTYTAAGAVTSMQLGNGRWESTQFNSRLQPIQIALGTVKNATDKLKLDFEYGTLNTGNGQIIAGTNNGNIAKQTITVPTEIRNNITYNSFSATQYYTYDALNRIKVASENLTPQGQSSYQSWGQTFVYDRYGNRTFDEASTTTLPKNCTSPNFTVCAADRKLYNPAAGTSDNKFSTNDGYNYDSGGNTTIDAQRRKFTYDAENKQTKVETVDSNDNVTAMLGEYFYDGNGKRVKKYVPGTGEITVFIYDASGKLVAENSTLPSQSQSVSYLTNDHLGSPRINTDANGIVTARHDYQPFGEEITRVSYGADDVRKQFTAYERDKESGLDYAEARYYSNQHGRFTSTDPILIKKDRLVDPQRLNLYAYVRNNPFKFVDTTGEDLVLANRNARTTFRQVTMNGLSQAERNNIRVLANGRVVLRNPNAINTQNASYGYQQIAGIVGNRNLTINVYSVAQGQTAQGVSYQDAYNSAGVTLGSPGDATRDVVIPVGGGVPVAGNPAGSGNTVATTEDTIFAHEVFGHANGNDGDDSITAENNYRRSRNPAIGERSGEDHRFTTEVTAPAEIITTTPAQIQTTIIPRPMIPLPTPPPPPPPKKPEELLD